ncbi:MAG: helix-turn-helix domain-containing protein [Bryobacterales bacterium]|nr:helix-turn-helix domain-containing protein [Bryobacterales bacterium]
MKTTKRKPLEFARNPERQPREHHQADSLHFLAQGESIHDACALVGVTRSAYEQWRYRETEFHDAVEAAHNRNPATLTNLTNPYNRIPPLPPTESAGYVHPNRPGSAAKFFKNPDKTHPG